MGKQQQHHDELCSIFWSVLLFQIYSVRLQVGKSLTVPEEFWQRLFQYFMEHPRRYPLVPRSLFACLALFEVVPPAPLLETMFARFERALLSPNLRQRDLADFCWFLTLLAMKNHVSPDQRTFEKIVAKFQVGLQDYGTSDGLCFLGFNKFLWAYTRLKGGICMQ